MGRVVAVTTEGSRSIYFCYLCSEEFGPERDPEMEDTNQDVPCPRCHHVETYPVREWHDDE